MRHNCLLIVQISTHLVNMKTSDNTYIFVICYLFYRIFASPNSLQILLFVKHINYQKQFFLNSICIFHLFLVNIIAFIISINFSHLFTSGGVWGLIQIILTLSPYFTLYVHNYNSYIIFTFIFNKPSIPLTVGLFQFHFMDNHCVLFRQLVKTSRLSFSFKIDPGVWSPSKQWTMWKETKWK